VFEQWLEEARLIAYRSVFNMAWQSRDNKRHDQAEDAAQEGVLAAVEKGEPNFNDEYALINFVNTSAKNSARNVWRSAFEKRTRDLKKITKEHLDEKDGSLPPDELVFQEERRAFLQQGLEDIGERCQKILTLYYYYALNDRQILLELEGDQANDNDRRMISTQRKGCLTKIRLRWLKKGVDPENWF
jgi:RNA polymerase sigma factor (sigma-70 family)